MSWTVVGVICASLLLLGPVLYVVMRWELRRAFKPVREGLDQVIVKLDTAQERLDRLVRRVEP